jgi:hypothetical protein
MIRKWLTRGQQLMAYKEAHQLITAVRTLRSACRAAARRRNNSVPHRNRACYY